MTIDVRVKHPDYKAAHPSIMAARDCFLGERAVKYRGTLYLPSLSGQKGEEYNAYKTRATFYSIVGRTVGALTGLAVQGDVAVKGNQDIVKQMKDSPHGLQLFECTNQTVAELLLQGKFGILLDAPAEAQTVGMYGYVSDSIINWDFDEVGRYVMVVLQESRIVEDKNNPYLKTKEDSYRVLRLNNGEYTVDLYDKDSTWIRSIVPTYNGKSLNYLPFFTALPDGVRGGMPKSPMEDMVSVNLSHYRTSADLEHGRHFVGLPTPVVSGADVAGKLKIGGTQAWVLPDKDAKAYYLEFTGQGLQSLEKALQEKEAQLSSLSSSIISRSIRGSESPDAIRMRMSSETASLFTIVKTTQTFLTLAYNTKARMEGHPEDIELQFPTQFVSGQLTADEVSKYSKIYLEGGLTVEDYVTILRRGGALSAARTDEEVKSGLTELAEERAAAAEAAAKPKPTSTV